ncbi:MAG: hypothetical protein Q4E33_05315 [Erysipelotrichaceae bacterium]|nr:hypothetical protein [Erysipelotrichaceae bacterium]
MKKNSFDVVAVVVACVLLGISAVGVVKVLLNGELDSTYLLGAIVLICSLNFLLLYLISGFTKGYAKLYKAALLLGSLNALFVTMASVNESSQYIAVMFCALSFGLYMVLAFAKNFGKVKSLIFCAIVILCRISGLVSNIISYGSILDDHVILIGSQLALSLAIFTATFAKYVDKTERGAI